MNKILDYNQIKLLKNKYKKKKLILCHGVFDLLHIGHINYFKAAKKLGDILVVSVTEDKFVNKGPGRPAFKIKDRIGFLKEINCINFVCISNAPTSERIIKNLRPNIYCKGLDYQNVTKKKDRNLDLEMKALKSVGGKFSVIKEESFSSSKTINDYGLQNFSEDCKQFINLIRKDFKISKIFENLKQIKNKKVLLLGETIIDKYITTEAIGKSGKEPMMVVKKKNDIKFIGGIGYVANLCASFAKKISLVSFLGEIRNEKKFIVNNLNKKISYNFLTKKNSPTIVKTRFLDNYKKSKIIGIYDINDELLSKKEEDKFYRLLKKKLVQNDLVIVTDYGHGIFTDKVRRLISNYRKKIYLNTQINSFNRGYHTVYKYKKVNTLVINESELRYETSDGTSSVVILAKKLRSKVIADNIIVTRGNLGSLFINCKNWSSISCPAFNQKSIDTIGAGDTFLTFSALCLASGMDAKIIMLISSLAAGYSTNQVGNISIFDYKILNKQLNHILK